MSDKINIRISPKDFEYDAYTLVKAFYPESEIETNDDLYGNEPLINIVLSDAKVEVSASGFESEPREENGSTEGLDRPEVKNVLKQCLYRVLSSLTGLILPWGTLTGIRPIRIPFGLMEEGFSRPDIEERLRNTYYISDKKIGLAMEVAGSESELLSGADYEDGYSLYVGIPYCPSICLYCTFPSNTADRADFDGYLSGLEREMKFLAGMYSKTPSTIYIGGGTPTVLPIQYLERLLSMIESNFDTADVREYTLEAGRPDTIDREKLRIIKRHGIGRISINPQSMNQKTLDLIGRQHTVDDIALAYDLAREEGFVNINMDTIIGLPGEGIDEVRHTMDELIRLDPESITVHSLAVKRAARLNLFKEQYREMGIVNNEEIMDMVYEKLESTGMKPYYLYRQKNMAGNMENVGYSKPGYEGLYNVLIMEEKQTIISCGAGSSTKRVWGDGRIERMINPKDVKTYLEGIEDIKKKKKKLLEA
ncbi:MAG: coproporphyrinogen dehydrogenase HemZ [Lachnospiraceae bacterium]|nr:coproporphyrinogen dehydrogenase HemZ [Lachnospiraceae bacterium]